ncbi:MAG: DNA-binding protein [Christensenellaceae bacterium]|nr:DNA-binding protein [Christensenellaceae bacterium]
MNGYIKAEVLAEQWNVSIRQVEALCQSGRIDGAVKFGNTWAIPADAKKPTRTGEFKPGRKPKE